MCSYEISSFIIERQSYKSLIIFRFLPLINLFSTIFIFLENIRSLSINPTHFFLPTINIIKF
uniref:Putative ovule protein n=1 Tax=Solanum chacoense TaxID=4108 RepID=A0A0V0GWM8_SOLCH